MTTTAEPSDGLFDAEPVTRPIDPRFTLPREVDLVYRKTNPSRIGRVWDAEVDPKGSTIYIEWLDNNTMQVVPVAELVVLTPEERAAYGSGRAS